MECRPSQGILSTLSCEPIINDINADEKSFVVKCSECGSEIFPRAKFCAECGSKTSSDSPHPNFSRRPREYQGPKKLFRSRNERWLAGVCGGIGEHLDVDPTLVRLIWFILVLSGGIGILAYLIAIIFIPESPYGPWSEPIRSSTSPRTR